MYGAKQTTLRRLEVAIATGTLNGPHAFLDGRRRSARPRQKRPKCNRGLAYEPVPPLFRGMENASGCVVVAVVPRKRGFDWRRVDASHQLADQLFLPAQRAVTTHPPCGDNGLFQPLVQVDFVELLAGKPNQLLAKRLQAQVLTLSSRLAGL